jgi:MFS family permease
MATRPENPSLAIYLAVRFAAEAAATAQAAAVGWTIYRLSHSPLALGLVGAAQFLPQLLLTLPAGELADRRSPAKVWAAGLGMQGLGALILLALASAPPPTLWPFYLALVASGAARAFAEPAGQALPARLWPADRIPRIMAWSSSAWQAAIIVGPAAGGLAYSLDAASSYGLCAAGFVGAALGAAALGGVDGDAATASLAGRIARIGEGLAFVRSQPIVLGAISLDLFVVLIGGADALAPVYASDILHVGPVGLGLMRSASAIGACAVALIQAHRPPDRRVGLRLFAAIAVYGIATLVFALSTWFPLSLAALAVVGASDMASVVIRSTLIQLGTPEAMRGRVTAVHMLFVGASSELGAFESGLAGAWLGAAPAVALGGVGALLIAGLWLAAFPALRRADRFAEVRP